MGVGHRFSLAAHPRRKIMLTRRMARSAGGIALLVLNLFLATGCTTTTAAPGTLQAAVADGVTTGITSSIATLLEALIVTVAT
jgi:hypothetical protein